MADYVAVTIKTIRTEHIRSRNILIISKNLCWRVYASATWFLRKSFVHFRMYTYTYMKSMLLKWFWLAWLLAFANLYCTSREHIILKDYLYKNKITLVRNAANRAVADSVASLDSWSCNFEETYKKTAEFAEARCRWHKHNRFKNITFYENVFVRCFLNMLVPSCTVPSENHSTLESVVFV